MGIFGIFSRKRAVPDDRPVEKEKAHVKTTDVVSWLGSETSSERSMLEGRAEKLCEALVSDAEGLMQALRRLGEDKFDPHDKTYAVVNMSKDTFVKKSVSGLRIVRMPESMDYASLQSFLEKSGRAIFEIKGATPKQAFLISNYFKQSASGIVESIKKSEASAAALSAFLSGDGTMLKKIDDAKKSAYAMLGAMSASEKSAAELADAESSLASAEASLSSAKGDLDGFLRSEEWSVYRDSAKRIEELENAMKSKESSANGILSALRKPMKKLSHEKGTAELPENPFIENVVSGAGISGFVAMIEEAAKSGDVELKPAEAENIEALKGSYENIEELRKAYAAACSERDSIRSSLRVIVLEKRKSLESRILELEGSAESGRKMMEALRNEAGRKKEESEGKIREAGIALQEATGKEVSIAVQKDYFRP